MNNRIIFGQYYQTDSWLHKLDPRVKLVSLLGLIVSLFIINNNYVLLGFFTMLFVVVFTTKVPMNKFLKSIKTMTFILVLTFIFQIIFHPKGELIKSLDFYLSYLNLGIIIVSVTLWIFFSKYIKNFRSVCMILLVIGLFVLQHYFNFGPLITTYKIDFYDGSIIEASFVTIRIIALLFISSLLTLTTTPTEINNGLEKLLSPLKKIGINASSFTMVIAIALRFIPNLILEAQKVLKAQSSRGADFKDGNLINRAIQVVSLIVPMFVVAYKKAIDLGNAMDARGYIPDGKRSSIYLLEYKMQDYLVYVFDMVLIVGMVLLRIFL